MSPGRRARIISRMSVFAMALDAAFWAIWSIFKAVPPTKFWYWQISRWFDVPAAGVFVAVGVWLTISKKIEWESINFARMMAIATYWISAICAFELGFPNIFIFSLLCAVGFAISYLIYYALWYILRKHVFAKHTYVAFGRWLIAKEK